MRRTPSSSGPLARAACFALATLLSPGCRGTGPVTTPATSAGGHLLHARVWSAALAGNLLGDSAEQRVDVYLPASYDRSPGRRYPVLYLLHGFLGSPDDFTTPTFQGMTIQGAMDTLTRAGRVREMIVVVPNGRNRYGGSFFLDSPVTGGWEGYLTRDVVGWVDRTWRTIPTTASRGIAGHSMGGYAALVLAMRHPELFGAVYAMSPCCVDVPAEFGPDNPLWARARSARSASDLWSALEGGDPWPLHGAAALSVWSPAPSRGPLFVEWPERRGSGWDSAFVAKWRAQLPAGMLAAHAGALPALRGLRGLRLDVGMRDQYAHIPPTVRAFSARLGEMGIAHAFEIYDGDHRNRLGRRMSAEVLPFFDHTLAFGDSTAAPAIAATRRRPAPVADTTRRHLVYLPPRNVELLGIDSAARLPAPYRVEVRDILRRFEREGFAVHSAVRPIRSIWQSADSTVADVRALLDAGVHPDRITLVGFGKGGTVALIAAARLGLPDLGVVALAPCTADMLQSMSSRDDARRLAGRLLFVRAAVDSETVSCRSLFARVAAPSVVEELILPDGAGAAAFGQPRDTWVPVVTRWASGSQPR